MKAVAISRSLRHWFLRFYGVHLLTFVVAVVLLGSLYGSFLDRTSSQLLGDLFQVTLRHLDSELSDLPKDKWVGAISRYQLEMGTPVAVHPLRRYTLSPDSVQHLALGQIVMVADQHVFIKQIEGTQLVIALGPIRYLSFMHRERWVEILGLSLLALLLGIPAYLAMQPLARELRRLDGAARQLSRGELSARAPLADNSPLQSLVQTFNTMAANVEALDRHKKDMASVVSHELRLPLARLRYRLDWIETQAPQATEAVDECVTEIDALAELVDELLLYSRLQQAQIRLQRTCFDSATLLHGAVQRIDIPAGIDLGVDLAPSAPAQLYADRSGLERALLNLVSNALRYARHRVQIMLQTEHGDLVLTVDDDGPGIPEAERTRVFEPFTRLDGDGSGHGLGLAIVQQIMLGHGGTARIEQSTLGGARVVLRWPQQSAAASG